MGILRWCGLARIEATGQGDRVPCHLIMACAPGLDARDPPRCVNRAACFGVRASPAVRCSPGRWHPPGSEGYAMSGREGAVLGAREVPEALRNPDENASCAGCWRVVLRRCCADRLCGFRVAAARGCGHRPGPGGALGHRLCRTAAPTPVVCRLPPYSGHQHCPGGVWTGPGRAAAARRHGLGDGSLAAVGPGGAGRRGEVPGRRGHGDLHPAAGGCMDGGRARRATGWVCGEPPSGSAPSVAPARLPSTGKPACAACAGPGGGRDCPAAW